MDLREVVLECVRELLPREKNSEVLRQFVMQYLKEGHYAKDTVERIHIISMNAMEMMLKKQNCLDEVLNYYFDMNYRTAEKVLVEGIPHKSSRERNSILYDFYMNAAVAASLQGKMENNAKSSSEALTCFENGYNQSLKGAGIARYLDANRALDAFGLAGDNAIEASKLGNKQIWLKKADLCYEEVKSIEKIKGQSSSYLHPIGKIKKDVRFTKIR